MGERLPCKQEVTSSNLVFSIRMPGRGIRTCTLKTAYRKKEKISEKIIKTSEVIVINR